MVGIEWDGSLETGDRLVDEQHRRIHALFNELEMAEDSPAEIGRVLDHLTEHVMTHFTTEEDLMRRESYPADAMAEHVELHRQLTDGVREKVLEFRAGTLTSVVPLVTFLREWITTHVHERDRQLIDYMRARGACARLPETQVALDEPRSAGPAA